MGPQLLDIFPNSGALGVTSGGSICQQDEREGRKVFLPYPGGQSFGGGRFRSNMGFLSRIRFPSLSPYPFGLVKGSAGQGYSNSNRSKMAKKTMVHGADSVVGRVCLDSALSSRLAGAGAASSPRAGCVSARGLVTERQLLLNGNFGKSGGHSVTQKERNHGCNLLQGLEDL